jgi:beta-xylosidase
MKKYIGILLFLISIGSYGGNVFHNPVIWADVPDPDVIHVGNYFYMSSTTMHLMPGAPIMRSKDLVNWETVNYLFDKLVDSPKYNMQGGTVYGRGQWATSLKYHDGKFYALFAPNDSPGGDSYIYTTTDPAKGWTLHSRMQHFHDSSLFFDDDGRVYVFSGTGCLRELNKDLTDVKAGGVDTVLFQRDSTETGLLEGSRAIKYKGKYYLLMVSWPVNAPRREVCYRADKITGPYEKKVILKSTFGGFSYVGQGTIVDDGQDKWYGMIFQDRGAVGRVLTLMPCRWIDGWPILGDENGKVPDVMPMPAAGGKATPLVVSDDFNGSKLKYNWQWNHNPIDNAWSLTQRKGFLRLKTSRIVDNIYAAPNTISQRMEGPRCSASVAIDISHMKDGDRAGFAAFNGHSGLLTISKKGDKQYLTMQTAVVNISEKDKKIESVDVSDKEQVSIPSTKIFLRIDADFRPGQDIATFYYSTDSKKWTKIGIDYKMKYDFTRLFMGTRYAIFNYATQKAGGYIDVDSFKIMHNAQCTMHN